MNNKNTINIIKSTQLSQLLQSPKHLSKEKKIQLGSYYTPPKLVNKVYTFITPYIQNKKETILLDTAGGYGAFLCNISTLKNSNKYNKYDYRIADCDPIACNFLKKNLDPQKVFLTNSLLNVSRQKFLIPENSYLVIIGNPPYNDITSEFKNGQKGANICDNDIYDKDMGISFLKSYCKLKADLICILHPLSYLIKETNFNRLRHFFTQYNLIKAEIFSSALFENTGTQKFPIIVALYEKNKKSIKSIIDYNYIKNFAFNIMDYNDVFILSKFKTTDGYINKYPPRKNDKQESPIGLYYYTFRDINSIKKNTSFLLEKKPNGIIVTLENFYKYCYLYAFKKLFNPPNIWLYGNLSPLISIQNLEENKQTYVLYALVTNPIFSKLPKHIFNKIINFYNITINTIDNITANQINQITKKIQNDFENLTL